ncbi:hypothetical protein P2318_29190 [Myxococcaceae bacterium GXIMD 01537]
MPRAFDITSATDSVDLDSSGHGEVTFTVSNALRAPVRARATVVPTGNARPEWMSISGAAERDFPADGTQQIAVRFQVPPGTPPGRYSFQLLVADVESPDERYAQGPSVAFTVVPAAVPVQRKKFPWPLVALVAGVVVILGIVVGLIAGRGGPNVGEPCGAGGDCGGGLSCSQQGDGGTAGADGGICLGIEGFDHCENDAQCFSGLRCTEGKCVRIPPGGACAANGSCPDLQRCVQVVNDRFCLLVPNETCERDLDCASLFCKSGKCGRDDGRCDTNDDCKDPSQCAPSKVCLLPNGQACPTSTVCLSGFCSGGTCQPAPPTAQCSFGCPAGSICSNGGCVFIPRTGFGVNQQLMMQEGFQMQRVQ